VKSDDFVDYVAEKSWINFEGLGLVLVNQVLASKDTKLAVITLLSFSWLGDITVK